MDVVIKRFNDLTLEELYSILRCRQEVFVVEQDSVYQDLDFYDQNSTHFFYWENGKVLSYLRVIDKGVKYDFSSIGRVLTLPQNRCRGLSRKLITLAIDYIRARGQMPIKIEAQKYLTEYYSSFGFKTTSDPYILDGLYHVDMILDS